MITQSFKRVAEFVNHLHARGRYTFPRTEAAASVDTSERGLTLALNRLSKGGRIVMLRRGFYVIVPQEYALHGLPPAAMVIEDLMAFLGHDYYVGLLTAAALHGAAHQQPQEFQVVCSQQIPIIRKKGVRIRFFVRKNAGAGLCVSKRTETGDIPVSSPELTALDLVAYARNIGGLDHVATVIAELSEVMTDQGLLRECMSYENRSAAQRLGYILTEVLSCAALAQPLGEWIDQLAPSRIALDTGEARVGCQCVMPWRVLRNTDIECEV